ncbi:predicted protein [Histoplasma capsulatum H143]|uniref:Uncharacterized protein n=1 Tax=Ajellomyces capsulatus (strain H143) TaxID=544712 RepID=C6HFV9_AJECH|nr:predicted protein [Histoplasma capsulatum H143]
MSRPNPAQRNLSLTEELERLEQSITLTLQAVLTELSPQAFSQLLNNMLNSREKYGRGRRWVILAHNP